MTLKLTYVNVETGELGRLPDNAIVSIGGVANSNFTVGGKPIVFSDGTASDGTSVSFNSTLQGAYDNSSGSIDLSSGKNFVINALNQKIFQVDADTGRVTITGDLTVLGSSTVVEGTLANVDQVSINMPDGSTSGLLIEPMAGVTMGADLVRIRNVRNGPSVFTIDSSGNTQLKQLSVAGTINGVDLSRFFSDFQDHINGLTNKHSAADVTADTTGLQNISGTTVQQALESIDQALSNVEGGGSPSSIRTHEHVQNTAQVAWFITHAKNSMRPTVTIYDDENVQTFPDEVKILDANTIRVAFSTPQSGRAIILLF